jgi:beta-lactamase superfamily II metal-dependent hydrolase
MIFSLEALQAKYGDSLLLHYGDAGDPKLIVIDGGPSGVFKTALMPRLEDLRKEGGGKLPIELLMVSHLDDDHVRGVLDFATELEEKADLRAGFDVKTLWVNAFEDTVGDDKALPSEAAPAEVDGSHLGAVIASVGEGLNLQATARKLHWKVNEGFDGLVMAPNDGGVEVDLEPLRLTVVGPRAAELEELRKVWVEEVKKLEEAKKKEEKAEIAEYLDKSVYNLSSIVCLAELGKGKDKKRMLLTGDARGDKILLGLEAVGLLKKSEPLAIDLLKMPHHGSSRNLEPEFFERIKAKTMVISANGKFDNPDVETLKMIAEARKGEDFTLYLTNSHFEGDKGSEIEAALGKEAKDGPGKVVFRPDDALSLRVDLLDPLP